jgi:prepilin-type N-terminal cleavage/methylation domain-containing protein
MKKFIKKTGFTLIELIIVISIIAVLSSLAFLSFTGETSHARDSRRKTDLKTIDDAIAMSNAKQRPVSYLSPNITTGNEEINKLTTNNAEVRVLRYATAFFLDKGLIDSSILAKISRDPKGMPYLAAFLHNNVYQLGATLENPETQVEEVFLRGSFQEEAILDNILVEIDNNDRLLSVANSQQFLRGDVLQINTEQVLVEDISIATDMILVTRGYNSTTATLHDKRTPVKLIDLPSQAKSLYCLGDLDVLSKNTADASFLIADLVPADLQGLDLSTVTFNDMYVCSSSGVVENEKTNLLYKVDLVN